MRNDPPPGLHKRIGKITSTMLGIEDHGCFTAMLSIDYGGSAQGVGGFVFGVVRADGAEEVTSKGGQFILGVLRVTGVRQWEQVKGRTVYVMVESDDWNARVVGLEPLPTEPGESFYFSELA